MRLAYEWHLGMGKMLNSNETKRTKTLAKDTVLFAISSFGSRVLTFLLTPLYTSILLTSEYGIADLINTTVYMIYPILTLAISDATLRFVMDKDVSKKNVFVLSAGIVVFSTALLCLLRPLMDLLNMELSKYWVYFVVTYFFFNLQECFANFIKGIGMTALFAIQGVVHTVAIIVCNILFLVVFRMGLNGYLLTIIIGNIVSVLIMFFGARLYTYVFPIEINRQVLKDMLSYSIPMIPTMLAWTVNTSIDKYMIIYLYGLGESGIYSVAHKIPTIISTILNVFLQAWLLTAISSHGDDDESDYFSKVFACLNVVCLFGSMLTFLVTKIVAKVLFAKEYYSAWMYVPMLVVAAVLSCQCGFFASAFRAAKKTKGLFISVVVGAAVNIALNLVFLKNYGTIGAAYATAISFLVVWIVRFTMVQKIVPIKINIWKYWSSFLLFIIAALWVTLSWRYEHIGVAALTIIVVLINWNTVISMVKPLYTMMKTKMVRKERKE